MTSLQLRTLIELPNVLMLACLRQLSHHVS